MTRIVIMPETINKSRKRRAIGGVFSSRENADKAIQAFRALGISEEDIHVVVSLYDQTREGENPWSRCITSRSRQP